MPYIQMMDMARSERDLGEMPDAPMPASKLMDRYPCGLTLSLGDDELEKLDLDKNPQVGDMIHLFAMARVVSCSQHEKGDGSKCCNVTLQITHLGLEDEDQESEEEDEAA